MRKREGDRQTDKQTDRQTDRQTDQQKNVPGKMERDPHFISFSPFISNLTPPDEGKKRKDKMKILKKNENNFATPECASEEV